MTQPRQNVPTWDQTFMTIAHTIAQRSKDPSSQVGAVIVSTDQRILSVGYNGAPRGFDDNHFPWSREGETLNTKYPFVVHAERNAILNFRGAMRELQNATIYITHSPCNECAKEIAQTGIAHIHYHTPWQPHSDITKAANIILHHAGITLTHQTDML